MKTRLRQIAGKVEDQAGTQKSLAAADARVLPREPKGMPDSPMFEGDSVRGDTLAHEGSWRGVRTIQYTFGTLMRGQGALGGVPQWVKYWLAGGWRSRGVDTLTIGAVASGPFLHGEVITQATTAATGMVVLDTYDGTTTLYLVDLGTGTWNGTNGITGGTSGATATPSAHNASQHTVLTPWPHDTEIIAIGAITSGPFVDGEIVTGGTSNAIGQVWSDTATGAANLRYRPLDGTFQSGETLTGATSGATTTTSGTPTSDWNPNLSLGIYEDGRNKFGYGAKGSVKLAGNAGEPGVIDFDLMSIYGSVVDGGMLQNVAYEDNEPPILLAAQVMADNYSMDVATFELDFSSTVTLPTSASATEGKLAATITDRAWTARMDPRAKNVAVQDFYGHWFANTRKTFRATWGSTNGRKFTAFVNGMYQKVDDGERDGESVDDLSVNIYRGQAAALESAALLIY